MWSTKWKVWNRGEQEKSFPALEVCVKGVMLKPYKIDSSGFGLLLVRKLEKDETFFGFKLLLLIVF